MNQKPETPKPETKSKPKTSKTKQKPEIRVNKRKLKNLTKSFDELRHKFDKKEINRYRKAFYNVKIYKNLSISKIKR